MRYVPHAFLGFMLGFKIDSIWIALLIMIPSSILVTFLQEHFYYRRLTQ